MGEIEKVEWIPFLGEFERDNGTIIYKGKLVNITTQEGDNVLQPAIGYCISSKLFNEGSIKCKVRFTEANEASGCNIIFNRNAKSGDFSLAGISPGPVPPFVIQSFEKGSWVYNSNFVGDRSFIKPNTDYEIELVVKGSNVTLKINNVIVTGADMPLINGQVGIWCRSQSDIIITDFLVQPKQAQAFVVIEYKNPYFDIYSEVIKNVCSHFNIQAKLAYQTNGPGIILSDIIKDIHESKFIIADITPDNPNVFYEVGYAHALNKPTILISENTRILPFDISSFRTIFYENSIGGKAKLEEGIQKHISSILNIENEDSWNALF